MEQAIIKDKEEILNGLLSDDPETIQSAARDVIDCVILSRETIAYLWNYKNEIKKNLSAQRDYGGGIAPNNRFVEKALEIIERFKTVDCLCEYAFDSFGQYPSSMLRYGFEVLSVSHKDYTDSGVVMCPLCKQKYSISCTYTGWHTDLSAYQKI